MAFCHLLFYLHMVGLYMERVHETGSL